MLSPIVGLPKFLFAISNQPNEALHPDAHALKTDESFAMAVVPRNPTQGAN